MIKAALLLSCVLCAGAIQVPSYVGTASQGDEGSSGYTYCDTTSGDITAITSSEIAKITVNVAGVTGDCEKVEPTMTDAEFEERFDLQTRVYFTVDLDDGGDLVFRQYGDEGCAYTQRAVAVTWDTAGNTCTDGGSSPGMLAEYYFDVADCNGYNSSTLTTSFGGDNVGVEHMIDPYPIFTAFVDNAAYNWTVNPQKGIRYNTFISDSNILPSSYCYGIGEKQALPYGYPTVVNDTYYHDIYAPIPGTPGALCGMPCRQFFLDAMETHAALYLDYLGSLSSGNDTTILTATGTLIAAVQSTFNSSIVGQTCHTVYQLGGEGIGLFGFISELATARPCNTCENVSPQPGTPGYNTLAGVYAATGFELSQVAETATIGGAMLANPVSSRMGLCMTSMAATWIHMVSNSMTTLSSSDANSRVIEVTVPVDGIECEALTDAVLEAIAEAIATAAGVPASNVQVSAPASCSAKTELSLKVEVLAPKSHSDTVTTFEALKDALEPAITNAVSGDAGAALIDTAVGGNSSVTIGTVAVVGDDSGDDTDDNSTDGGDSNDTTTSGSSVVTVSVFSLLVGLVAMWA